MRFIMTEDAWEMIGTLGYRGVIGLFYQGTWSGILALVIFILVCLFAIIGIITVLKFLFFGRKRKEDPHQKWLRTGKM